MTMDKTRADQIANRAIALLKPLETEFGIKIRYRGGKFSGANLETKIEFAETQGGITMTKEVETFRTMSRFYGLEPSDLGKPFLIQGRIFTLVGMKPRQQTKPILGKENSTGQLFRFTPEAVKANLIDLKELAKHIS